VGNITIIVDVYMKLQKQLSRKAGEKKYPKYVVVIPPKSVDELGWKEGEELVAVVDKDRLIMATNRESKRRKEE